MPIYVYENIETGEVVERLFQQVPRTMLMVVGFILGKMQPIGSLNMM